MPIVDSVTIDTTNSVLDQLVSPYKFTAPPLELNEPSPEAQLIEFPGITQQTLYIGAVTIEKNSNWEVEEEFSLPEIKSIGKARLKVRKIAKLSRPQF